MTTEAHHRGTILPGAGRSPSLRRRLPTAPLRPRGAKLLLLALSAAVVLMGACSRQNKSAIDPTLKAWFDDAYKPAIDDMSKAAGAASGLKEGCQAASDALQTHAAKLVKTPDSQLTQLVQGFIDERMAAYKACVDTGETPTASAKTQEIQKRVNELTAKGTAS